MSRDVDMIAVDIVIIGLNEGKTLPKVLIAAKTAAAKAKEKQGVLCKLVYVDSYSSDGSVAIAEEHKIDVVYSSSEFKTCSHARNKGIYNGNGRYVQILDGDMELHEDWIIHAINYLEANSDVAGVSGIRDDQRWSGSNWHYLPNYYNTTLETEDIETKIGGAQFYRRDALEEVGGFEPEVAPSEDLLLLVELNAIGHRMVRIRQAMITHWDMKSDSSASNLVKKFITNKSLMLLGVMLRYFFAKNIGVPIQLWNYYKRSCFSLIHVLIQLILILVLLAGTIDRRLVLATMGSSLVVYFLLLISLRGGLFIAVTSLFIDTVVMAYTVVGFVANRPAIRFGLRLSQAYKDLLSE